MEELRAIFYRTALNQSFYNIFLILFHKQQHNYLDNIHTMFLIHFNLSELKKHFQLILANNE